MKKAATKKEQQHMDRVAAMGCIICGAPAEIHHIRKGTGMGCRESHYKVLPLCFNHHSVQTRLRFGHAVHKGTRSFEKNYGCQLELLSKVYIYLHQMYPEYYPTAEVINDD